MAARLFIRPSEDPNGLLAQIVGEGAFLSDDPQIESRRLLDLFFFEESERTSAEVVLHEELGGGAARLVAAMTGGPPGAAPLTVIVYVRTELTARGLLLVAVTVPEAAYEPRRKLLHQLVDALRAL